MEKILYISIALLVGEAAGGISNNLVEDVQYPNCEELLSQIPFRNVKARYPLKQEDLYGRWYSQRCETRPGGVHVLREYEFLRGNHGNLTLHVYGAPYCRKPSFSIHAQVQLSLKRGSMVTPGGTEAEYALKEISIVPHTSAVILDLVEVLNNTFCSASVLKALRPHQSTTLYQSSLLINDVTSYSDLACVPPLANTWNELQLLRLEEEGQDFKWRGPSCRRKELFLGDLHSDPSKQREYRPTAYQVPLQHQKCMKDCSICERLSSPSTTSYPPALPFSPSIRPPKLIEGHWASIRCEVQRYGLFLTRKITFRQSRPRWAIKQRYFYDPSCKNATYTILASGSYKKLPESSAPVEGAIPPGDAFDMTVRKMGIIPEDKNFAAQLNRIQGSSCGISGHWRKGKLQDVTKTGGCAPIGLKVPSKEPEMLRFEARDDGQVFLYLGQTPTWPHWGRGAAPRPTAWGPKLQQCSIVAETDNHLRPMVGARVALATGNSEKIAPTSFYLILTTFSYTFTVILTKDT